MAASHEEIKGWLKKAQINGASHLVVCTDTFDWDDYPIYVMPAEDVRAIYKRINSENMQRVTEVYSLKRDLEAQLNEHRALHLD